MGQGMMQGSTSILLDADRNLQLRKDGYTIFPLLDTEDIKALSDYYFNFQKEAPQHFYSSTHSADFNFRKQSSDFIKELVGKKVGHYLRHYQLLGGAFVVKPPKGKGLLPPHQDWNIVDERITRSFNLWIPLVNVTVENGAVYILEGSHSKNSTFRGPGIASIFRNIEKEVWQDLTPLPMQAGEALLYDHALLHASPVNQTDLIRLGIVCGIIPSSARMQLYFKEEEGIGSYEVNEDFFLLHDPLKGPAGLQRIEEINWQPDPLTLEVYRQEFLGEQPPKKRSWIKRLFG